MILEHHNIFPSDSVINNFNEANTNLLPTVIQSVDDKGKKKKFQKLRMTLPHILLIVLLCCYIVSGAFVLYRIEHPIEVKLKQDGLVQIVDLQDQFESLVLELNTNDTSLLSGFDASQENDTFRVLFRQALHNYTRAAMTVVKNYHLDHSQLVGGEDLWTLSSSILFAFSIITTIGWGNISPVTFYGKLFCILYGLVGIPFAMLVIANIGKFLSEAFNFFLSTRRRCCAKLKEKFQDFKNRNKIKENNLNNNNNNNANDKIANRTLGLSTETVDSGSREAIDKPLSFVWVLLIVFGYLALGGLVLPVWEKLSFFDAFYFAFVSITTTGFGDIVPANHKYLALTLTYIAVGVAFTTIGVELAAGYMRKLHYVGRRIKGAKFALVRFGGKEMSMNELLNMLGKKYNIPKADLHKLSDNFDHFIENALNGEVSEDKDSGASMGNGTAGMIRHGSMAGCHGNWMENWIQDLNGQRNFNKGPFTISDEDIRFIDDDRLVSTV